MAKRVMYDYSTISSQVPVGGCMYAGVASAHGVGMDTLIKLENAQVPYQP